MSPSNPPGDIIRFAAFELDPETGELRKRGIRVKLADQPFRVLHYLAGRPGQIATREELRNLLWPDTAFIDADHGLNAAINKIREALGDNASDPRYIETIPRRGYRFVGEIEPVAVPPPANESADSPPVPAPVEANSVPAERRRPWKFVAAAAVAVAAAGAWLWNRPRAEPPEYAMRPLTADSGLTAVPSLSRDGRLVAYASDRAMSNNLDIWVHPLAQGGQPIRLTTHAAPDVSPAISPDGGLVAFQSERDGGGIYLVPALGGEERLLVRGGRSPRFSPDGKSIAYCVGGVPEVPSRSYAIAVSGGPARQLASDLDWTCHPVFSDDGRYVVVDGAKSANEIWHDWWITPVSGGPSVKTGAIEILREQFRLQQQSRLFPDFANGKAVFAHSGRIWEMDFSAPGWKPGGPARPLTNGSQISLVRLGADSRMVFVNQQSGSICGN